jgi:hypothetical protein
MNTDKDERIGLASGLRAQMARDSTALYGFFHLCLSDFGELSRAVFIRG